MIVKSYREILPIECEECGCEYQYELGDEIVRFSPLYGSCRAELYMSCPVCQFLNKIVFGERKVQNEESV